MELFPQTRAVVFGENVEDHGATAEDMLGKKSVQTQPG